MVKTEVRMDHVMQSFRDVEPPEKIPFDINLSLLRQVLE